MYTNKERKRLQELNPNCLHVDLFLISHPIYNYECKRCGKRFVLKPKNDWFETNVLNHECHE